MQSPFFTIITVCLNAGNGLIRTINSILNQKFDDLEIIIKDGGSTDSSIRLLQNDSRIKIICTEDSGIYDAMNQALSSVSGKYVLFLNAADFFVDDEILTSFHDAIITNNYPGLVYCDYTTTGLGSYISSPSKLTKFFLFRTMLCHQVCMINSTYYKKSGSFNTNIIVLSDYDFLLRLVLKEDVTYYHIKKLGIIYSSGGFSYQNRIIAKKELLNLRKKYFKDKYLLFSFIYTLTFPIIRNKIASGSGFMAKSYHNFVNFIYSKKS